MKSKQHSERFMTLVVMFLAVAAVALGVVAVQAQSGDVAELTPLPARDTYQPSAAEQTLNSTYERVSQSVVNISVAIGSRGTATGTGFVIDADGHIVTNNHVVEDATYIEVTFVGGHVIPADLIGRDPAADLAVIKVDPSAVDLTPVMFADSDNVIVGQNTLAIGSPFGQAFTLTTGIVSALDRSLQNTDRFSIPMLIQTDAAINPGNSGGPLLNEAGEVIGVNTAILSGSGTGSGVGFSIPSNTVRRIVPYLIENGEFDHAWLGISGVTLQPAGIRAMELPEETQGVVVATVTEDGPSANLLQGSGNSSVETPFGLVPVGGDVITAIDGSPITDMEELISYLEANTLPGDVISLDIWRDGQQISVDVPLQARP